MSRPLVRLGDHVFVTKLAGYEHTKYLQYGATREKNDVPLIIGRNIKDGRVNSDFEWYIPQEISDALPRSVLNKQCILIPYVGSLGDLGIFQHPFVCHLGSNVAKVELLDEQFDIKYLYYYLKSPYGQRQLLKGTQGSVQDNITMGSIRDTLVVCPSPLEQKRIASVLSALDDKIALNTRINAELEAMAKLLYDYWFVQFDFPDAKGRPYKSSGGAMVHNAELKREVPEGWTSALLADCIERDWSGDWGQEEESADYSLAVNCIRGADLDGLNGVKQSYPPLRYILPRNERKILHSHDLIVEISGGTPTQSTGRLAFITEETLARFKHPLVCSNFCKAVSIKNKEFLYNFAHHWNDLYAAGALFGHEGKTSGIRNLLFDSFTNAYRIVVPEASVVKKFYSIMQTFQAKKQQGLVENQELTTLRDWLLPLLMNGQVVVGEAEEQVGLAMAAEGAGKYERKKR